VVGQSAAGWLVAAVGAAWTIGVDAVSSLMSAASLKLIAAREPAPERHGTRMRAEIGEGLRYVFQDRLMRPVVLANTMVSADPAAVHPAIRADRHLDRGTGGALRRGRPLRAPVRRARRLTVARGRTREGR
jgi:hypothetical protein